MTRNEKAIANLKNKGIYASEANDLVYVHVGDTELELSEYELDYQAKEYDEDN